MILVMGASGNIGRETVNELKAKGAEFRAGYRSDAQIAEAQKAGVEAVLADYTRPETLAAAVEGIDRLFFVSPPTPDLAELESNIVDAAQKAGVKRLVKLSVWGAPSEAFQFSRPHRQIEKKIEASGMPYTFLRPNGFMQNMLSQAATIKGQGAFYLPAADARVSHIDLRDIGRVAAVVLTEEGHEGKAYDLSGPESLSYADCAAILSEVLGKNVAYVSPPNEMWKSLAIGSGLPEWLADGIIDLQRYYNTGDGDRVSSAVEEITGREPVPFRRFAEDYAEAFR